MLRHLRVIARIVRKDLFDALRDSRILVSLATPIVLGLIYNTSFDSDTRLVVDVAHASGGSAIPAALAQASGATAEVKLRDVADATEARALVASGDADLGLVLAPGVDAQIRSGAMPTIEVYMREPPGTAATFGLSALDAVIRSMGGQRPPAVVGVVVVSAADAAPELASQLGVRRYFVLATVLMLIGMIGMLVVPILIAEETEKRTLDALLLVASHGDVVAAKAIVGAAYVAVSVPLLLSITRLVPADIPTFALATALATLTLVAFGLLIGGLFKTAAQAYTWSSFFLLPVMIPPFVVGLDLPDTAATLIRAFPTAEAMRLAANGVAGRSLYPDPWQSVAVMAGWAAVAFALLHWRLRTREA